MKILLLIVVALKFTTFNLVAAEAGMPQLDSEYWASQAFWLILIFSFLYLLISKVFLPKIKNGLETRENKIKNDLDEAKNLKELSEKKQKEYEIALDYGKKSVAKIILDSNNKLNLDIQNKKKDFEKEINKEIEDTQKEINLLKKNSIENIAKISENITSNIIEEISGEKLNESSVKAAVEEISKNKVGKYL